MARASCAWLKSLQVSDSDISRGKNILKTDILDAADNSLCLLESMQQQVLLKGQVSTPVSLANDVNNVAASDVKAVSTLIV